MKNQADVIKRLARRGSQSGKANNTGTQKGTITARRGHPAIALKNTKSACDEDPPWKIRTRGNTVPKEKKKQE